MLIRSSSGQILGLAKSSMQLVLQASNQVDHIELVLSLKTTSSEDGGNRSSWSLQTKSADLIGLDYNQHQLAGQIYSSTRASLIKSNEIISNNQNY